MVLQYIATSVLSLSSWCIIYFTILDVKWVIGNPMLAVNRFIHVEKS
jgi:hypothetical protein